MIVVWAAPLREADVRYLLYLSLDAPCPALDFEVGATEGPPARCAGCASEVLRPMGGHTQSSPWCALAKAKSLPAGLPPPSEGKQTERKRRMPRGARLIYPRGSSREGVFVVPGGGVEPPRPRGPREFEYSTSAGTMWHHSTALAAFHRLTAMSRLRLRPLFPLSAR